MSHTGYRAFCDRVCSYVMSYELGIPFQWETPLPQENNGRHGERIQERLRLTVVNRQIHYYQRTATGEEYEIQPDGPIAWLPTVPEQLGPPATEEQLQATETMLGFPLPAPLRALYAQVANGGFGPSQGLLGALGGGDKDGYLLTDDYLFQKAQNEPIALGGCKHALMESEGDSNTYLVPWEIVVPQGYWPDQLLPLIHDGCNMHFYLDGVTNRVFYSGAYALRLRLLANSLEELFERWARDDLSHPVFPGKSSRRLNDQPPFDDSFDPFLDQES